MNEIIDLIKFFVAFPVFILLRAFRPKDNPLKVREFINDVDFNYVVASITFWISVVFVLYMVYRMNRLHVEYIIF